MPTTDRGDSAVIRGSYSRKLFAASWPLRPWDERLRPPARLLSQRARCRPARGLAPGPRWRGPAVPGGALARRSMKPRSVRRTTRRRRRTALTAAHLPLPAAQQLANALLFLLESRSLMPLRRGRCAGSLCGGSKWSMIALQTSLTFQPNRCPRGFRAFGRHSAWSTAPQVAASGWGQVPPVPSPLGPPAAALPRRC